MLAADDYSPLQLEAIRLGQQEANSELAAHPVLVTDELLSIWDKEYQPPEYELAETDVVFGMTIQFRRDVAQVEKKLQGRILQAIGEILDSPKTPRGDTVKPLAGELKGLWRYRIGDYRLVYQPSQDGSTVMLVSFASRGSVYGD
jgi:mRNA interferase RelE/StbE